MILKHIMALVIPICLASSFNSALGADSLPTLSDEAKTHEVMDVFHVLDNMEYGEFYGNIFDLRIFAGVAFSDCGYSFYDESGREFALSIRGGLNIQNMGIVLDRIMEKGKLFVDQKDDKSLRNTLLSLKFINETLNTEGDYESYGHQFWGKETLGFDGNYWDFAKAAQDIANDRFEQLMQYFIDNGGDKSLFAYGPDSEIVFKQ